MGESGCLHLPSSLPARPHNLQGDGSRLSQDDSDCSRVVRHDLVLGPGQFYRFRFLLGFLYKGPGNTALVQASSLEPQKFKPECPAPRAFAIQEHGFCEEVAARIKAPYRPSTRAVCN